MILQTPVWYRLVTIEIAKTREFYEEERSALSLREDAEIAVLSKIISDARAKCSHEYPVLFKEDFSRPHHTNDTYVCTHCLAASHGRNNPFPSTEIVPVTQEELLKFFCK